jgi:hypothetical protein
MDANTEEAKRRLAELATTPTEGWDQKVELLKNIVTLIKTGDAEAQRFVVEQIRRAGSSPTAGRMALALLGAHEPGPANLVKQLGMTPAQAEVIRELESFLPTSSGSLFRAAVQATIRVDGERAVDLLAPFLSTGPTPDAAAMERTLTITTWAMVEGPVRPLIERVLQTAARLDDARLNDALFFLGRQTTPEWEVELANLLALDLPPQRIHILLREAVTEGNPNVGARRRKRLLPLLREVADRVRDDPKAQARLEEAERAIELPGSLLSTKPAKPVKAPKAPARLTLKDGAASDGGPVLALPAEAVDQWRGVLLPNGKPGDGNFAGTDYGRACNVSTWQTPWGPYGLIDVGNLRGLVLGRACNFAKLKDGSCLLVMEGDEEAVAGLLAESKPWKKLEGLFEVPSGELVLFDSAHEKAKTNNKAKVKLATGKFTLDEYVQDDDKRHLWVVRLTPA